MEISNKIIIYTDGGARGNPGPAAIGVVIHMPSSLRATERSAAIFRYNERIGNATNNEAEYQAVTLALKKAKQLLGKKSKQTELEINVDSELICKQISGEYKIKLPHLQKLFVEVWNLKQEFKDVKIKFVRREQNKEADKLVNEALDE